MRLRTSSWWRSKYRIFSNIVLPGTSRMPPVMTRPGSPQACRSTAVTTLVSRNSEPARHDEILALGLVRVGARLQQLRGVAMGRLTLARAPGGAHGARNGAEPVGLLLERCLELLERGRGL